MIGRYKYNLLLALVAVLWGATYGISKICLEYTNAFTLLTVRFLVAFAVTFPFFYKRITPLKKSEVLHSAQLGIMMFCACLFMVLGVGSTSATNAGFLVGLSVVFIPLIQFICFRERIGLHAAFALAMSLVGICLLTLDGGMSFHGGDVFCLASAFCYGAYVVFAARFLRGANPIAIGTMQFLFIGLYAGATQLVSGGFSLPSAFDFWKWALVIGVFCTAFCFIAQSVSQQHLTPTAAGIILTLEPVSSAVFAFAALGEVMGARQIAGALLMLAGVMWVSLKEK
ncbi:DMT family transporter [Cloacibacillus sp. An23]|uniref:DMT family transporter n=1 Tax=Cloacibacillus sp. An23 TaxID=1965591 RepID=UPI0013024887|nr:DMT family transporter [Cloacibacillus sp. An23]